MIKSRLAIIGTLLFVSATVMASESKNCRSFLKVINNDSRMEIPQIEEVVPRKDLQIVFENITRFGYEEGRSLRTASLRSGQALEGERTRIGTHRNYITTLFVHTAGEMPEFPTKQDFIPKRSEAYLGLQISVFPDMTKTTIDEINRIRNGSIDSLFGEGLFHSDKLNEIDLKRILTESADKIGPESQLHDLDRVGRYRLRAGQVEVQIKLDSLSFAEFVVLMNGLVMRLEELSSPTPL